MMISGFDFLKNQVDSNNKNMVLSFGRLFPLRRAKQYCKNILC